MISERSPKIGKRLFFEWRGFFGLRPKCALRLRLFAALPQIRLRGALFRPAGAQYGLLAPYFAPPGLNTGFWRPVSPRRGSMRASLHRHQTDKKAFFDLSAVYQSGGGPGIMPPSSSETSPTSVVSPLMRSLRPCTGDEISVVITRSPVFRPSVT